MGNEKEDNLAALVIGIVVLLCICLLLATSTEPVAQGIAPTPTWDALRVALTVQAEDKYEIVTCMSPIIPSLGTLLSVALCILKLVKGA